MITSDEIRCLIPTDVAVKGTELFCSTSHPVSSADSATFAAWVTAIATVALAVLAYFAWHNSKETLRQMRTQMEVAEKRALLERQLPLLNALVSAVQELKSASEEHDSDMKAARSLVQSSWMNWSSNLSPDDESFRAAAGKVCYHLSRRAEKIGRWRMWSNKAELREVPQGMFEKLFPPNFQVEEEQTDLIRISNNYCLVLETWQTNESRREHEEKRMNLILSEFE